MATPPHIVYLATTSIFFSGELFTWTGKVIAGFRLYEFVVAEYPLTPGIDTFETSSSVLQSIPARYGARTIITPVIVRALTRGTWWII